MKQAIFITDKAKDVILNTLENRQPKALGLRIGVKTKGCSGLSYSLEFVDELSTFDEKQVINEEFSLFIDPKAIMFVLGTQMDYKEEDLESGFVFSNPNESGRCGCGDSFYV